MSDKTSIQWCNSTVNPMMGCLGCELFPSPQELHQKIDTALASVTDWRSGQSRSIYSELIRSAYRSIKNPLPGHSPAITTTNLWHLKNDFIVLVLGKHGSEAALAAERAIRSSITCYAASLHLNKARSLVNPSRSMNSGYAPVFEKLTRFEGRVGKMARTSDLRGNQDPDKPWLASMPRLVFVSDMGDAFSRKCDFSFLESEVIDPIRSPEGQRHFWLWLSKRPKHMAEFGNAIRGFPSNVCVMTTVTGPDYLYRVDQLREVQASVRGLSLEPLWDRIPPEKLNLQGISWVIVGGQSGRKDVVRDFDLGWARELRDHCRQNNVSFFLKQLGRRPFHNGKSVDLTDSHGGDWNEWPSDLRIREMPEEFRI